MVVKRDFAEDAIAKRGQEIGDAIVTVTKKGEIIQSTTKINPFGKKTQIIEVDSQL